MISAALRQRISQQAAARCGYCLTQEVVSGIPLTLEHLAPKAKGGEDIEENLWLFRLRSYYPRNTRKDTEKTWSGVCPFCSHARQSCDP